MTKKQYIIPISVLCFLFIIFFFLVYTKKHNDTWKEYDNLFDLVVSEDFSSFKKGRVFEKVEEAQSYYDKRNDDPIFWLLMGNLYEYVEDLDRAILAYHEVLRVENNNIVALLNLGRLSDVHTQDIEMAEHYYKKAIDIDSGDPSLYITLAQLYQHRLNDSEKAEEVYLLALEKTKNSPIILVKMIILSKYLEKTEQARVYAKKLLLDYPNDSRYQRDFGYLVPDN